MLHSQGAKIALTSSSVTAGDSFCGDPLEYLSVREKMEIQPASSAAYEEMVDGSLIATVYMSCVYSNTTLYGKAYCKYTKARVGLIGAGTGSYISDGVTWGGFSGAAQMHGFNADYNYYIDRDCPVVAGTSSRTYTCYTPNTWPPIANWASSFIGGRVSVAFHRGTSTWFVDLSPQDILGM